MLKTWSMFFVRHSGPQSRCLLAAEELLCATVNLICLDLMNKVLDLVLLALRQHQLCGGTGAVPFLGAVLNQVLLKLSFVFHQAR